MASTSDVTSSPQIQTSEYKNYPLNSFSGEETALKVSALVLAFLCLSGAVAMAMGGQYVLPEIIMAPIPQMIIESTLGLAAIGLLIEVIVFSVKTESTLNNQQPDPNIDRAKAAFLEALTEQNQSAQVTIEELQAKIQQLEQSGAKPEEAPDVQAYVQKIEQLNQTIREIETKLSTLATEKQQLVAKLSEEQQGFDETKKALLATVSTPKETNQTHVQELESVKKENVEAQQRFCNEKTALTKASEAAYKQVQEMQLAKERLELEKQSLLSQKAEAQSRLDEAQNALAQLNIELQAAKQSLVDKTRILSEKIAFLERAKEENELDITKKLEEKQQLEQQAAAKTTIEKEGMLAKIQSLEETSQLYLSQKENLTEQIDASSKQIELLKVQVSQIEVQKQADETLLKEKHVKEISANQQQIANLKKELANLEGRMQEISTLTSELQLTVEEKNQKIQELEETCDDYSSQYTKVATLYNQARVAYQKTLIKYKNLQSKQLQKEGVAAKVKAGEILTAEEVLEALPLTPSTKTSIGVALKQRASVFIENVSKYTDKSTKINYDIRNIDFVFQDKGGTFNELGDQVQKLLKESPAVLHSMAVRYGQSCKLKNEAELKVAAQEITEKLENLVKAQFDIAQLFTAPPISRRLFS